MSKLFSDFAWNSTLDGSVPANISPVESGEPGQINSPEVEIPNLPQDEVGVQPEIQETEVPSIEPTEDVVAEGNELSTVEDTTFSFKTIVEDFREKGLLDFDAEKEYDDTEDLLYESVEYTVNKKIEEKEKAKYGEKGLEFLKHLEAGGTVDSFIQVETAIDYSKYSVEDKENQKAFIANHYAAQGYTPEEIDEEIKTLEDLGEDKLLKKAQVAQRFLIKEQEAEKARILQEEASKKEQQKAQELNSIKTIETTILTIDKIAGLTPSKEEREAFKDYLLKPDRTGKTQYQKEIEADKNAALEMAYLKFKKFNLTDVEKKATTKVTSKLKAALSNYKDTNLQPSSGKPVTSEPEKIKMNFPSFLSGIQ